MSPPLAVPPDVGAAGADVADAPGRRVVLRVQGLRKHYGDLVAVDGIDLELYEGEVFGLLGPNGSGKSTTIGIVLGFLSPTAGVVEIMGHDLHRARGRALRQVGGLAEAPSFYPYLSGRENLELIARVRRLPPGAVDAALRTVDLMERADANFGSFSHGLKQRLGIAGALLHAPRLVILDEPTSGLDPAGTAEIRELIPRIAAEGRTVLLASHLLHEVEQVCDRVAILQRGNVVARGAVRDLLGIGAGIAIAVPPEQRERAREVLAGVAGVREVRASDDGLTVSMEGGDGAALNRALAEAGIFASRLGPAARTLEAVFLELTTGSESGR